MLDKLQATTVRAIILSFSIYLSDIFPAGLDAEFSGRDTAGEASASYPRESSRYFGKHSALSQSLSIRGEELLPLQSDGDDFCPIDELEEDLIVKPRLHQFLLEIYFTKIHPIYPFLDSSPQFLSPQGTILDDLHPIETFILQMVYSIACQCVSGSGDKLLPLSDACHSRALK
jgi:hypothetical protein